jgi:predicted nuclease of predicted toxin-antitoxin system
LTTGRVLRFLADESCDFTVVRALRADGHDVDAVSEHSSRSVDHDLVMLADRERRVLLTEDKDFGWLVFVSQEDSAGVILIRYPGNARARLGRDVSDLVRAEAHRLSGSFIVLQPGQVRISRLPESQS